MCTVTDLEKFGGGEYRCILTKQVRIALRSAESRSFEGVPGVSSPGKLLKVTLKSMHILRDFNKIFCFIIAFCLIYERICTRYRYLYRL